MSIENMKLVKCKQSNVVEVLKSLGLPTEGSLKAVVTRLATYYADNAASVDLAICDVCGGESDAGLPACAYCGEAGPVEDTPTAHEAESETEAEEDESSESEEEPEEQTEEEQSEEEQTEESEEEEGTKMATKKVAKKKGAKKQLKPAALVASQPKGKKASKAPAKKGAKKAAPTVEESDETAVEIVDSTALDEQVEVIREAVSGGAVNLHRLGAAANKIVEENLWKHRIGNEGVPQFRTFKQFCVQELGMSFVHVYRAMKVATEFSENEVAKLSGKQVRLVLEVPKEARGEMIEAAGKGEKTSELTERANKLRGGRTPLPEPKKGITVAVKPGHSKLKMYKRPTTGGGKSLDTENATVAKKLADAPWTTMDLSNKVRMILRVFTNDKGEIVADVEFRRGEPVI